jgi:hypothetical protein
MNHWQRMAWNSCWITLLGLMATWTALSDTLSPAALGQDKTLAKDGQEKPVPKKQKGVDPNDPSVVYDEPWRMIRGFFAYNGKAYDKTCLWVEPNVKLVLPDQLITVERRQENNVVAIFMEKRGDNRFHVQQDVDFVERRKEMGCSVKLEKGALMIRAFGEFSYKEGAFQMTLKIIVPEKASVEQRAGLIGERPLIAINATDDEPRNPLTKKSEMRADCWLPPSGEDGWHEIPAAHDKERQAAKK